MDCGARGVAENGKKYMHGRGNCEQWTVVAREGMIEGGTW